MSARQMNRLLDIALFAGSVAAIGTGLLLLIEFHMGSGARATEFAGLSKAFWRNAHRFVALLLLPGLALHLWLHRRYIKHLLERLRERQPARLRRALWGQTLLLATALVVSVSGFAAWTALPYWMPTLRDPRHACIDIHNVAGLLLLVGLAHHIHRRWKSLVAG